MLSALLLVACADDVGGPAATEPLGDVAGQVVDETGAGVAGAQLTLTREGAQDRVTMSAANGSFGFAGVEAGLWQLGTLPPDGYELDPVQLTMLQVTVPEDGTAAVVRQLRHLTGGVAGIVLDELGRPIEGVQVDAVREGFASRSAVSAVDGSFAVARLAHGEWRLEVTPPAGFALAPGQASPFATEVDFGGSTSVEVVLRRDGPPAAIGWRLLRDSPVREQGRRHSDVFFLDTERGWIVNLSGEVHRTQDGGTTWSKLHQAASATFYRSVGFASPDLGWAGNLNWTHSQPDPSKALFETRDGGVTWTNITDRISGPEAVGICGIWVVDPQTIYAVGRWSGPAIFLRSRDGGVTWRVLHEGTDVGSWAWKISFPTEDIGYVATQGPSDAGVVLKTTDGGETWSRIVVAPGVSFSGIGFATPDTGWVGAFPQTFQTTDGGATWTEVDLDPMLNRFRMLGPGLGFAAGTGVYRYTGS